MSRVQDCGAIRLGTVSRTLLPSRGGPFFTSMPHKICGESVDLAWQSCIEYEDEQNFGSVNRRTAAEKFGCATSCEWSQSVQFRFQYPQRRNGVHGQRPGPRQAISRHWEYGRDAGDFAIWPADIAQLFIVAELTQGLQKAVDALDTMGAFR